MKHFAFALALAAALLAAPVAAKTLRWASQGDPQTADPYSQNEGLTNMFSQSVHDTLVMRDNALRLVPGLAVSWQQVNASTWRFNLRKGVKFHNGNPFTADDVIASLERIRLPASNMTFVIASIDKIVKIDDHTIDIVTTNPDPTLLLNLPLFWIMDKEWLEANNAMDIQEGAVVSTFANLNVNGTGPFMLESREPDIKTVMIKNPKWWGLEQYPHNIDKMVYTPITNASTRVAALLSGEVDFLLDPPLQDLPRIEKSPNLKLQNTPQLRTIFYGLEQRLDELRSSNVKGKNPLKDVRVRKAMHMAIDINGIQKKVMRNLSVPANVIVPPGIHGYPEDLDKARPPYNPEAAKKLLAEAGYPDGFEINLDCPNDRYNNDEKICQATVGMLGKIGIKVNLVSQPKSLHFPKITTRNTDFYMLGWGYAYPDAHFNFVNMMHSESAWNGGGITIPRVDQLIDDMAKEMDTTKRDAMIREVFEITTDQQVFLPLHHQVIVWAMSKKFEMPMEPRDEPRFCWGKFVN